MSTINTIINSSDSVSGDMRKSTNTLDSMYNQVGNYFSNRRIPSATPTQEVENALTNALVSLEHLKLIAALPPMYDNIVDPPTEVSEDDYQYRLKTLYDSTCPPSVGRAYVKNVLASGNFLTLVPLQIEMSYTDVALGKVQGSVASASPLSIASRAIGAADNISPANLWKSFSSAIDIGSYGYRSVVASKRYWRHVAANMKVILYALGIDVSTESSSSLIADQYIRETLPSWIVDNIFSDSYLRKWSMNVEDTEYNNDASSINFLPEGDKAKLKQLNQSKYQDEVSARAYKQAGKTEEYTKLVERIDMSNKQIADLEAKSKESYEYQNYVSSQSNELFYESASLDNLKKWVMAVGKSDAIQNDLPMITFYVNGTIEKSYGVSQNVSESELAAAISGNFLKNVAGKVADKAGNGVIGGALKDLTGGGIPEEMSYLTSSSDMTFANAYVPKINKGVDGDMSYNVPIRSIADGSDPVSLAMHLYTLALLMPFYIEPAHKRFKHAFVPKSPLIVSAFSKGIFNIPKGVISNIDIKTDPVFQTTESVSTDIEINLTITPFINKGFSPDFDSFFNQTADSANMLMAMFNPFSSFNILVTMCGLNTTMTKINEGLFSYIFLKKPSSLVNIAFESWSGLKSSLVDFKSTTIRNLNTAKAVRTN